MATIIEMVNMTRLDCALMAAGGMRIATAHAVHHATHRRAFGAALIDQPAMANVLADLALDSEAATTVVLRLAGAVDRAARGDSAEARFRRVALSVTKYWLCKRLASHTVEALECLGGNGYVEDSGMPRLYREAPLVSIWEGSGNVAALDTLRAMAKDPGALEAFFAELELASGTDARYDDALAMLRKELHGHGGPAVPGPPAGRADGAAAAGFAAVALRRLRPWPRRSSRRGWAATGALRTGRCRWGSIRARSSTAPGWASGPSAGAAVRGGHQQLGAAGAGALAVRQQLAEVLEDDHAVAQQAPALLGVRRDDVRRVAVERVGGGASRDVAAETAELGGCG